MNITDGLIQTAINICKDHVISDDTTLVKNALENKTFLVSDIVFGYMDEITKLSEMKYQKNNWKHLRWYAITQWLADKLIENEDQFVLKNDQGIWWGVNGFIKLSIDGDLENITYHLHSEENGETK